MKRSEINRLMRSAKLFFEKSKFYLPEWAYWSPEKWKKVSSEADEIRTNKLGWDITDFGSGDFNRCGLLLFTIRNGSMTNPSGKTYAEKIMVVEEKQITPMHYHWKKMEDIINRSGGELVMKLYKADSDDDLSKEEFYVSIDGIRKKIKAGTKIRLKPGQSITLEPFVYHSFWAEKGKCLVGEVSKVNDDSSDNRFFEKTGRFPLIEEDEKPLYLLCNEYPALKNG